MICNIFYELDDSNIALSQCCAAVARHGCGNYHRMFEPFYTAVLFEGDTIWSGYISHKVGTDGAPNSYDHTSGKPNFIQKWPWMFFILLSHQM